MPDEMDEFVKALDLIQIEDLGLDDSFIPVCDHCHGTGIEPDAGNDMNPEPVCTHCGGY